MDGFIFAGLTADSDCGLARRQFSPRTVLHLAGDGFTDSCARSRIADGPHGSTSAAHDAGSSLDLAWARPCKPLLHGLPQRFVEAFIAPISRWSPMKRLGKLLAHPAVCWLAATGTLVGWHIPALFALGLQSEAWHGIEHASFLISGLLFWWPVIQPWPTGSKWPEWSIILYLFLATLPCDILSGFLVFCDRVVYPVYLSSPRPLGFSALEDQQCAGALMWTCVTVVYLTAGAIVAARLLSPQSLRQYRPVKSEPGQPGAADDSAEFGGCLNVRQASG